jgi:hypothetical protein
MSPDDTAAPPPRAAPPGPIRPARKEMQVWFINLEGQLKSPARND